MDKTKDDAFRNFLEKIQGQNKAGLLISTLQLKYERETAGEDADKREEQLEQLATAFENVEKAITGMSVKFEFEPVVNALENQTQLLQKSLEEQALLRKVSEGSLEYDKESAQYRNLSGKELTSDVSGKTIKQGAYVDFETAANRLQGQGKRVRESEQNQINFKPVELGKKTTLPGQAGSVEPKREKDEETTGFGNIGDLGKAVGARLKGIYDFMTNKVDKKEDVKTEPEITNKEVSNKEKVVDVNKEITNKEVSNNEKVVDVNKEITNKEVSNNEKVVDVKAKPEITGINPESDNIQSTQEVMADSAKKDVELTAINNNLLEQQLKELKKISAALAPSTPSDLPEGRLKPTPGTAAGEAAGDSGGGLGLGDALAGLASVGGLAKKAGGAIVKGAKVVGKGALSLGGGIAKFAASGAGKALGATAAVGLGAYTAYKGYTAAEDSKQSKLDEVQAKVDSGEMKPEEAATARKEIGNTATVEKSGAVGEGTGMAAGAIAGGMAGAKLGAAIGSIIPGAGTVIGAGIGTIAGGALGAFAGSSAGKYVGEKVGSGINAVKGFFGGKTDTPGTKAEAAVTGKPTESKTTTSIQFSEMTFAKNDPENYKKFIEFKEKRIEELIPKLAKSNSQMSKDIARKQAELIARNDAIKKFQKEIESSGAGKVETKSQALNKEQQAKTGSDPGVGKAGVTTPQRTEAGVAAFDKAYQEARSDGKTVKESKEIAFKARNAADVTAQPKQPAAEAGKATVQAISTDKAGAVPEIGTGKTAVQPATGPGAGRMQGMIDKSEKLKTEATKLGIDPNTAKGTFEGGVLTKITDSTSGKEHKIEVSEKDKRSVEAARSMRAMNERSGQLAATASASMGSEVSRQSTENSDLTREANMRQSAVQPIISSNVSNNNTQSFVPIKPSPRAERSGSALDRYNDRVSVY
jgi:hypothetical protein